MLDENWRIVEKNQQGINLRVTPTVWRIPRNVSETIHSLSCHRLLSIAYIQTNRGRFLCMIYSRTSVDFIFLFPYFKQTGIVFFV